MLDARLNDDEDTTDEEAEEDANIPDSDVEQDEILFSDEDNKYESESDYESTDAEYSEDIETESCSKQTQKDLQTKLRDGENKVKDKNESKKSLTSGEKTSVKKKDENSKTSKKTQMHKNNINNKVETKNESNDQDEYVYDSSDEEDICNTVGKIPMKWYDEYNHIGYDWEGNKILKPEKGDELDNFLKRMEDPDFWKTIKDPQTGQDVILSEADIDLIVRIQKQKIPDTQFDEYAVSYIYSVI